MPGVVLVCSCLHGTRSGDLSPRQGWPVEGWARACCVSRSACWHGDVDVCLSVLVLVAASTEDVCIVERLFSSSLVAIVSLKAPRKLKVCHFKKGTEICNYSYSNTILAVKLNRQRLIVCLEESLYIHNIRDMKVLHTIRETPPNPAGLCALSINNDNCYLAYPGSATIGEVQVFDTINLRAANMIPAHDSPLAALTFDASGTKLATASEKGTVIRVFSIPEGQKLFEFRRGVKRCVSICSLAFSMDGMFLSASSNTETVHIFKLETVKEKPPEEPTTWTGYFGKVLMASTSYLPSQVTEMFNQGRAFATVRLPFCGHKNICSLATIQKIPRLLVGASDGYLYMYNLDPQEGGECALMRQHRLDRGPERCCYGLSRRGGGGGGRQRLLPTRAERQANSVPSHPRGFQPRLQTFAFPLFSLFAKSNCLVKPSRLSCFACVNVPSRRKVVGAAQPPAPLSGLRSRTLRRRRAEEGGGGRRGLAWPLSPCGPPGSFSFRFILLIKFFPNWIMLGFLPGGLGRETGSWRSWRSSLTAGELELVPGRLEQAAVAFVRE
uniref:WD repeat domain phosphoinositide-interacting protein 2 n=1 Tax=Oryctolagus cuniculus TaxID=9986 RepID=G1SG48_RABIT